MKISKNLSAQPYPHPRHRCSEDNAAEHLFERVSELCRKVAPSLETIENFRLQADLAPRVKCVVPDDTRKDEADRKLDGLDASLACNHNQERRDERRVAARESSRMEEMIVRK